MLLLTARDAVQDRISGLDKGADDYLGKPFDLNEVAARLRALDRRSTGRSLPNLVWQNLTLNPATMEASLDSEPLILSRREFAVLSSLMQRPGVVRRKNASWCCNASFGGGINPRPAADWAWRS